MSLMVNGISPPSDNEDAVTISYVRVNHAHSRSQHENLLEEYEKSMLTMVGTMSDGDLDKASDILKLKIPLSVEKFLLDKYFPNDSNFLKNHIILRISQMISDLPKYSNLNYDNVARVKELAGMLKSKKVLKELFDYVGNLIERGQMNIKDIYFEIEAIMNSTENSLDFIMSEE